MKGFMKKDLKINRDKLLKLIGFFDEAMTELDSLKKEPKEKVISSRDRYVLEQLFYRIAMISIDICFHLAASLKGRIPDTYKGCFQILAEEGIINIEMKNRLVELAGLRNLIAHVYWNIDYGRLYDFLDDLEQLKEFRAVIIDLVRQHSSNS